MTMLMAGVIITHLVRPEIMPPLAPLSSQHNEDMAARYTRQIPGSESS